MKGKRVKLIYMDDFQAPPVGTEVLLLVLIQWELFMLLGIMGAP